MLEQRGSYDGPVEIWVGDAKRLDALYYRLVSEHERSGLVGQQLDLKFPNGQTGRAVMTAYNAGALTGVREPPF